MENEIIRKIRVKYVKELGYRTFPATGVYAGPTPSGDVMCKFFVESQPAPDEIEIDVLKTGDLDEKARHVDPDLYVRSFQVGIVMNPITAKAVGEFITQKAEELLSEKDTQDIKVQ